ncbi:MAG: FecR domain-containing protein [Spirochaetales bacterium]|nr:FecR domain-containing protein [Spirochaetales bacterium]
MKPRRADLAVAFASAALFIACVVGLALDLGAGIAGSGERVGTLVLKKRVAQRRPAGRAVWTRLSVNDPLRAGEAIRTDAGSEAVVLLDDGTELALAENSLVLLEFDPAGAYLEFVGGNVSARREGVAADAPALRVKAAGVELELGSGALELEGGDGSVEARASAGSATARIDGLETVLSGGAGLAADSGGSRVVSYGILTSSPAYGAVLLVPLAPDVVRVELAWEGGAGPWLVELSRTRDFVDALALESDASSLAFASGLGAWHWRVRDAGGATSPVSRFSVLSSAAPEAFAPGPGASFDPGQTVTLSWSPVEGAAAYEFELSGPGVAGKGTETARTTGETVSFVPEVEGEHAWRVRAVFGYGGADGGAWSEARTFTVSGRAIAALPPVPDPLGAAAATEASPNRLLAPADGAWFETGTELTLARSGEAGSLRVWTPENPGAPIAEFAEGAASARFTPPGPGAYLWGLDASDGGGERRRFEVIEPLAAPLPRMPGSGETVPLPESRSLTLSWDPVAGAVSYRVTVRSADGGSGALERASGGTSLEIRGASLETGEYHWRVVAEGRDPEGNPRFGPPASATFSVSRGEPLAVPAPLRPAPGAVADLSRASSLDISWTAVAGANRYELELRDSRGRLVARRETSGSAWSFLDLARLDKGRYTVSVAASYVAADGVRERSGPPASWTFTLVADDPEKAPELVGPKEIYVLDD